jgi:Mce-associated membrane protein
MPSRERLSGALDVDGSGEVTSSEPPMSVAGAEEAVALAEARAEAARARAKKLTEQADSIDGSQQETTDAADVGDTGGARIEDSTIEAEARSASAPGFRPQWLRRPRRKTTALGVVAALIVCGSLATSGYLLEYSQTAAKEGQRTAEFAAAARQQAVTLMSIDANKARDDVQRIIDNSTGQFKVGMLLAGEDIVKSVEQSKVSTTAAVQSVAVESMTNDSAVVLVAAKAEATNPDKSRPPPRQWRIIMTLQRDGGQPKISAIEVLP